jgi:hypothetical protein
VCKQPIKVLIRGRYVGFRGRMQGLQHRFPFSGSMANIVVSVEMYDLTTRGLLRQNYECVSTTKKAKTSLYDDFRGIRFWCGGRCFSGTEYVGDTGRLETTLHLCRVRPPKDSLFSCCSCIIGDDAARDLERLEGLNHLPALRVAKLC